MFHVFLNANTRFKILTGFLVVIFINLLVVGVSIYALSNARQAAKNIDNVISNAFTRIQYVEAVARDTNVNYCRGINYMESTYNPQQFYNQYEPILKRLEDAVDRLQVDAIPVAEYPIAIKNLQEAAKAYTNHLRNKVSPLLITDKADSALDLYTMDSLPLWTRTVTIAGNITKLQTSYSMKLADEAANPRSIYLVSILAVVGVISAISIALCISGYIAQQIKGAITHIDLMADGDFTKRFEVKTKDEFGHAVAALNKLNDAVRDIVDMTQNEVLQLDKELERVRNSSQVISKSTSDVESQAMTVAAASDEMVSTTADIARNCETAAHGSDVCREITSNGVTVVQRAFNNVQQQVANTKDNSAKIELLAAKSRDISMIVSAIDDIAAQTNLLALNAAIEAARSGEAGRGFAVVADEVRNLAIRTAKSTQEINEMVQTIQEYAESASVSITNSVENMDKVANDAKELENLLNDITSHVVGLNSQITQIATSAEEQTTATGEISANAQNVTQASSEMTAQASMQNDCIKSTLDELKGLQKALSFFRTGKNYNS
ncbi:HAMP domain-containing methyl-accepting chemotaxis protein [Anaerobiospirillum sp. NML120448]|uniref:methyl-accepting chemotaxis protein n=1 Tax=Anaerobiospirillum sp. NML120448 TaxID=2932816 RepID=UPI001FF0F562|nr:HAMP domain-containing methyl-accepting chemotaxis protein [Anaerobiospirillum sp. NML120448]MCK0513961.1 HAMP domain-containing methyl-accepting chemotaxis protein [Anaerobiospirillum sp. NML120448]